MTAFPALQSGQLGLGVEPVLPALQNGQVRPGLLPEPLHSGVPGKGICISIEHLCGYFPVQRGPFEIVLHKKSHRTRLCDGS